MITVATTLDVPIKLQFEAASRKSILGLGDIVIPGMVMAWALRLDLWLHYLSKIRYEPTPLELVEKDSSGTTITTSKIMNREVKAPYANVKGRWGDWFWLATYSSSGKVVPPPIAASFFPKPYFMASMAGYLVGMIVTLAMLIVFKHGQPALLYLVPGVLGSIYLTAALRGELKKVWSYTEDGSLDKVDVIVELDGQGNPIKHLGRLENGVLDTTKKDGDEEKSKEKREKKEKKEKEEKRESGNPEDKHSGGRTDEYKKEKQDRRLLSLCIELAPEHEA